MLLPHEQSIYQYVDSIKEILFSRVTNITRLVPTSRNMIICDVLLVTLLILVTEWYVFHDEMSVFVISCK
jgi:hypothetical protein